VVPASWEFLLPLLHMGFETCPESDSCYQACLETR
jgi:hypothetical protein